jgi:transcription antitermination factor NusA-like protein
MKFPICKVCLKSDILCSGCSDTIKKEKISSEEIETFRQINKLVRDEKHLKDSEIKRIVLSKNFILIVTKKEDVSKLIGKNGIIAKKIAKKLNKQIRIVADTFTIGEFAKEIFFSTPILGINVVYSKENERYRIRIPSSERVLLPITPENFSEIASSVFKTDVELVFE